MDIMPYKYGSHKTVWERHKKKWGEKEGVWKNIIIIDSLVSRGYASGLIKVDYDLTIDSSTIPAKKGMGKRLATTTVTTRRLKEAKYMR